MKSMKDPAFPETRLWWNYHGRDDDQRRHSRICGYCDCKRVKLHPGVSVEDYLGLVANHSEPELASLA